MLNKEYAVKNNIKQFNDLPPKVLQFGEGNFLRAFVDWKFNELNKVDLFNGSIIVVQPLADGMINTLNEQDGLYTLVARGVEENKIKEKTDVISSIRYGVNPYENWGKYIECAEIETLRFVVSNTTEAGIVFTGEERAIGKIPNSFPAKVTEFLFHRYEYFKANTSKGMVFLPCELINNNGTQLREAIIQYSLLWNLGDDFLLWINEANQFINTLVDRIVPGYPRSEVESFKEKLKYEDNLLDTSELFHLWVIEANGSMKDELPFNEAGLNVVWTNDLQKYRTLKVRILNGLHTMMVLVGYLSGEDTVDSVIENKMLNQFVSNGLFDEIIPTLDFDETKKNDYANSVLERFQNPFLNHQLMSIALNSFSKYKVRVLPSLKEYISINSSVPKYLAFSLAALIQFYKGVSLEDNSLKCKNDNREYSVRDDENILKYVYKLWNENENNYKIITEGILGNEELWDEDLTQLPGLAKIVEDYLIKINFTSVKTVVEELIKN